MECSVFLLLIIFVVEFCFSGLGIYQKISDWLFKTEETQSFTLMNVLNPHLMQDLTR